jgi:hypothetical protein
MRGFLASAVRHTPSETQVNFSGLSRSRRTKLAKAAHTTLVKADQWARGDASPKEIGAALEQGLASLQSKKK